jgi:transcription elongation factor Elf1
MIDARQVIPKFNPAFTCPKCSSDKCSTRLDIPDTSTQDAQRRKRLAWPAGELMVQTCAICGHVQVSRPLDYQEPSTP